MAAIPVHSHGEREQVARAPPLNRALLGPRRRQAYIACASNVPLSYDACKRSNRGTYLELHRKFQTYQLGKRVHQSLTHHELVICVTLTQSGRCKLDCMQLNSKDCHITLRCSNGQARRLHRRQRCVMSWPGLVPVAVTSPCLQCCPPRCQEDDNGR